MSKANPRTSSHGMAGIAAWNFKTRAEIHSYQDCDEFVRKCLVEEGEIKVEISHHDGHALRFKEHGVIYDYEIGPNMRVVFKADCYAIVLYDTEIIRYYPDGTFSVDDGGFPTPTTRERMQAFVPEGLIVSFKQRQLGLWRSSGKFPAERRFLWPLDHNKRIDPEKRDYAKGE